MLKERSEEELRKLVLCELHAIDGLLELVDKVKKTIWTNQTNTVSLIFLSFQNMLQVMLNTTIELHWNWIL